MRISDWSADVGSSDLILYCVGNFSFARYPDTRRAKSAQSYPEVSTDLSASDVLRSSRAIRASPAARICWDSSCVACSVSRRLTDSRIATCSWLDLGCQPAVCQVASRTRLLAACKIGIAHVGTPAYNEY